LLGELSGSDWLTLQKSKPVIGLPRDRPKWTFSAREQPDCSHGDTSLLASKYAVDFSSRVKRIGAAR